ncbi:MAG: heparinase II/III-family protein [Bacteroidaceae bacterium]|nr:heparinase II/III-family protein [Bacteroidaceae bacterium]
MKRLLAIAAMVLLVLSASAYTERNLITSRVTKDALRDVLVPDQKWVNLPAYSDRAGWDALLGENRDFYIKRGERALSHEWPRVKATDYLEYERSGNRTIMENPLDANNNAVADLLLAELAEGKGRFTDQLVNGVYAAAEMTSWALSAHIPAIKPGRSLQPYDRHVIDLVAGDMGTLYSWVHYFMKTEFDKINPEISRRLRHELKTRVLDPYLEYDKWWWDGSRNYNGRMLNNWNPWCQSNVLMTAMLMENDKDRYTDIVYNTMLGVDKFLNYIKGDGACEEGPSYWGHAAGKTFDYVDMLCLATGGKVNISNEKLIRDMGEYIARSYVGDGWVVNFADASARGGGDPYLVYRYGKAADSDLLKSFAALMLTGKKAPANGRDIYRTLAAFSIVSELKEYVAEFRRPPYTWYPETEFCYISTPRNLFFASKGGFNDESHNHNDAGTFSVWADNFPIIIDAGVGTYTRQTFSRERYSIWTMQSGWHNLPVVNGYEQPYGRKFKASDVKAGKNSFALNLANAYPAEAGINSWTRAYSVKGREVKVTDRFDLKETKAPNVVNFLSWGTIDTSKPGVVTIDADGHKASLTYDASQFDVSITDKELPDTRLSNVWGPKITRISLTDKKPARKGFYSYTIRAF